MDNFEEVLAKQSVVFLQDSDLLHVIIAMPESIIRSVRAGSDRELSETEVDESSAAAVRAMASFEGHPDISFALTVKELATRADPDTQTFRVTLSMPQPDEFTVLPGMTAEVEVDFAGLMVRDSVTWVPARAVQADADLDARVFVLDPDEMVVRGRGVRIGRMSGDMIEIIDGLDGGEEIVMVGAEYLSEGMRVTRMRTGEQAVPREDETAGNVGP